MRWVPGVGKLRNTDLTPQTQMRFCHYLAVSLLIVTFW